MFRCYVIAAIAGYGMSVLPFLITMEMLPTEKKTLISMMINFPFVIGTLIINVQFDIIKGCPTNVPMF